VDSRRLADGKTDGAPAGQWVELRDWDILEPGAPGKGPTDSGSRKRFVDRCSGNVDIAR